MTTSPNTLDDDPVGCAFHAKNAFRRNDFDTALDYIDRLPGSFRWQIREWLNSTLVRMTLPVLFPNKRITNIDQAFMVNMMSRMSAIGDQVRKNHPGVAKKIFNLATKLEGPHPTWEICWDCFQEIPNHNLDCWALYRNEYSKRVWDEPVSAAPTHALSIYVRAAMLMWGPDWFPLLRKHLFAAGQVCIYGHPRPNIVCIWPDKFCTMIWEDGKIIADDRCFPLAKLS